MLKTFPIDFIRQIFEQKLLEEHIKNLNYFGGKDQVGITSFYEQLKSQDEVDRFVDNYRQLSEQQNRSGLIMNGVLVSPENPTITNLYSSLIVPMTFTCANRVLLANRDESIETINNLIETLKGRKVDVAQLKCVDELSGGFCYKPFKVGTIGQNEGQPIVKTGDFLGDFDTLAQAKTALVNLTNPSGLCETTTIQDVEYLYVGNESKLKVAKVNIDTVDAYDEPGTTTKVSSTLIRQQLVLLSGYTNVDRIVDPINMTFGWQPEDGDSRLIQTLGNIVSYSLSGSVMTITVECSLTDEQAITGPGTLTLVMLGSLGKSVPYRVIDSLEYLSDEGQTNVIFPPENVEYEKYKVSFSFDAVRCDEPRTLNANEYCELTYSGSATLVSDGVALGNDLLKISIQKKGIAAQTPITFSGAPIYFLEPLEMPSGSNLNTQVNQLVSNNFLTNTHTDSIALTLQYSFIYDKKIDFLKQLFNYARYGTRGITVSDISPNMAYELGELWCSWGELEYNKVKTRLVENIDIENTESDALTIGFTMQIQGEND